MGCGIFTRKARKLIFHNKIEQSGINFTRFSIGSRRNRSANKIIVVGIGKVTQFSILSHRDKQSIQHTSTQEASEKRRTKKGEEKAKVFENRFRSGGEENERRMANNVMRGRRVYDGYLVCLDLSVDLPDNGAKNPSCYLLSMRWFSLEEERVM